VEKKKRTNFKKIDRNLESQDHLSLNVNLMFTHQIC